MADLSELLAHHKSLRFPEHSQDDALEEMLLELAEYDGYLFGLASEVSGGGKPDTRLASDDGLLARILRRVGEVGLDAEERRAMASYVESLQRIRKALAAFGIT